MGDAWGMHGGCMGPWRAHSSQGNRARANIWHHGHIWMPQPRAMHCWAHGSLPARCTPCLHDALTAPCIACHTACCTAHAHPHCKGTQHARASPPCSLRWGRRWALAAGTPGALTAGAALGLPVEASVGPSPSPSPAPSAEEFALAGGGACTRWLISPTGVGAKGGEGKLARRAK